MSRKYYQPKEAGYEKNIRRYLQKLERLIERNRSEARLSPSEGLGESGDADG